MLNPSPAKKVTKANQKVSNFDPSLDDSLKNLMKFAQSEYGLDSANQFLSEQGEKSTVEMINIIKEKLSQFQDSVKKEQQTLNDLKKECRFLQEASLSAKRLKQKSINQDYLTILSAEATNEFFYSRVAKMREDYEDIQNQVLARKELVQIVQQKAILEKELQKKRTLVSSLEKSIALDEKSFETQLKRHEISKEKEANVKSELEIGKQEIREMRSLKKAMEEESKDIEDFNLKEKLKSFLIANSTANEDYENELVHLIDRIARVKDKISATEQDISSLEGEIIEKKRDKVKVIESYIEITHKFDECQKPDKEEELE